MRRGMLAFAAVFAAGLVLLIVLGVTRKSDLVYSTGAQVSTPVAILQDGDRACQEPYLLPSGSSFDRVAFSTTTYGRRGAPLRVEVIDVDSRRRLASGTLDAGYPDYAQAPQHIVRVGRVATSRPLRVCFVSTGGPRVGLLGQPGFVSPHTHVTFNGRPSAVALAVTLRTEPRSLLALIPDMFERAARFRAGWVTPAAYWVLGVLLLVAAPVLLARGIARAAAEDRA